MVDKSQAHLGWSFLKVLGLFSKIILSLSNVSDMIYLKRILFRAESVRILYFNFEYSSSACMAEDRHVFNCSAADALLLVPYNEKGEHGWA